MQPLCEDKLVKFTSGPDQRCMSILTFFDAVKAGATIRIVFNSITDYEARLFDIGSRFSAKLSFSGFV